MKKAVSHQLSAVSFGLARFARAVRVWRCRNHQHGVGLHGAQRCMDHPWVTWETTVL